MGAEKVRDGVQFTVCLPCRNTLELFIYNEHGKVTDHVNMLDHRLESGVFSCVIKNKNAFPDGYSYCYEADGIRVSDPFMKNSSNHSLFFFLQPRSGNCSSVSLIQDYSNMPIYSYCCCNK